MNACWPEKMPVIGLVGPIAPPPGGMAMQAAQLQRLLEDDGVEVRFLATNPPLRPHFIDKIRGIRALFRLAYYIPAVWKLAGKVGVIHLMANSGWSWHLYAAPVLWLSRLRGTPVVVNYRGGLADQFLGKSGRSVKLSLRTATRLVVPSAFLAEVFQRRNYAVEIVPNVIDTRIFHPIEQPARDTFTIAVTRNLEPIYAIDQAILAFEVISKKVPEAHLLIAGSGYELKKLRQLVENLHLDAAVTFLGKVDREPMAELLRRSDVVLNPTTADNMPNSVLEALASGVPVVTTSVGGIPYLVKHGETALLVPAGDYDAMASAVLALHSQPELRRQLADNGLAEAQRYVWENVREQWLSVYSEALIDR